MSWAGSTLTRGVELEACCWWCTSLLSFHSAFKISGGRRGKGEYPWELELVERKVAELGGLGLI